MNESAEFCRFTNGGNISRVPMQDDVELCHHHRSSTSLEMIRKYLLLAKIDLEGGVFSLLEFPLADDQTKWLKPAITNCEHFGKDEIVRARIQRLCQRLQNVEEGGKLPIASLLMVGYDLRENITRVQGAIDV